MKLHSLPNALGLDDSENVLLVDYVTDYDISKQHIVLNHNTFSFLIAGTKEVIFDNSSLSIEAAKLLLMKAGHCLMTEKRTTANKYRSVLLFFNNEILLKFMQKNNINISKTTTSKSVHGFEYDEFIKRFVASLISITKLHKDIKKKLLEVKLEEILLYLSATYGMDFLYNLIENKNNTSQNFINTIHANSLNKLSLKEWSFLCHMSVSTFKREFEKHFNNSPIKWMQNKRLEHANYLLHQEQKTATEVYVEMGYENLSSFIQAYKLKYGITPKQHHKKRTFSNTL